MASEREDVDHAINEADVSGSEQTVQTDSLSSVQPSFSYMQAMAGFMGVVEAPKAADPAAAAAAALEFLNTMWQVCEVISPQIRMQNMCHTSVQTHVHASGARARPRRRLRRPAQDCVRGDSPQVSRASECSHHYTR